MDIQTQQTRSSLPCSLTGTYGILFSGTVTEDPEGHAVGPVVVVGTWKFHDDGTIQGNDTVNKNAPGGPLTREYKGTYTKPDKDCSGTISLVIPNIATKITVPYVIVEGGEEILMIQADQHKILSGRARRL